MLNICKNVCTICKKLKSALVSQNRIITKITLLRLVPRHEERVLAGRSRSVPVGNRIRPNIRRVAEEVAHRPVEVERRASHIRLRIPERAEVRIGPGSRVVAVERICFRLVAGRTDRGNNHRGAVRNGRTPHTC